MAKSRQELVGDNKRLTDRAHNAEQNLLGAHLEVERLKTALSDRDEFIFARGLANDFIDWCPPRVNEQQAPAGARLDCRLCGQTYGFSEKHICEQNGVKDAASK